MRTSCLINNYNYGRFLPEALDSALSQSVPFDEIIVVDDGSTDHSRRILKRYEAEEPRITVVTQPNSGQLSTFNTGYKLATGNIIFFLDADDTYAPNYLERTMRVYAARPDIDFAFCGREVFGTQSWIDMPYTQDMDFGYSVAGVALGQHWIGGPTSCISMRRQILDRLLPAHDLENSWTICADLCLVYGASLARARKYFVAEPLVRYRAHPDNRYFGKQGTRISQYNQRLSLMQLNDHYMDRFGYHRDDLAQLLRSEFRTIPRPTKLQLREYTRTTFRQHQSLAWKLRQFSAYVMHFASTRKRAAALAPEVVAPAKVVRHMMVPEEKQQAAKKRLREAPVFAAK